MNCDFQYGIVQPILTRNFTELRNFLILLQYFMPFSWLLPKNCPIRDEKPGENLFFHFICQQFSIVANKASLSKQYINFASELTEF